LWYKVVVVVVLVLAVVQRAQCRNEAVNATVNAMAARGVGTSRRAPLDALQGFGKVLVEKE
jgi:hypothetical protein